MSDTELRPCPFCGGEAEVVEPSNFDSQHDWFVKCNNYECYANVTPDGEFNTLGSRDYYTREDAIEEWNNRPQLDRAVEAMRKAEALFLGRTGEDKEEYVDRAMDVLNDALSDLTEGE